MHLLSSKFTTFVGKFLGKSTADKVTSFRTSRSIATLVATAETIDTLQGQFRAKVTQTHIAPLPRGGSLNGGHSCFLCFLR
jgi:hypothetical protein